jgi:hypothetical protein
MSERILGPTGSKRRRRFLWVPMLLVACVALFVIAGAQSFPGGPPVNVPTVFELDASLDLSNGAAPKAAVTDNTGTGLPDDWDRICKTFTITNDTSNLYADQCASAANDHAVARSFDSETAADGTANNASIFTGGGSKDQQALGSWNWKDASGGLPDKDNLLHAMAARYSVVSTQDPTKTNAYVFFGADRFDNSGDSQIGFWFFRTPVCTKADGSFGTGTQASCSGTATHSAGVVPHSATTPGDILILSDFTNGGTQPTIRIFEYVGACTGCTGTPTDGTLNLLGGNTTDIRDCAAVSTDDFCASVNNQDGAVAPWLFKNKSGQTTFGHGEFYEGGLNLNTLGLQNECFSSFLAETRSSQSVTATLKDFVLGGFQQCGASMATTPHAPATIGANGSATISDDATIHVSGGTTPPAPTGDVKFYLCSSATAITSCASTGTGAGTLKATKPLSGAAVSGSDYTVSTGDVTVTSAGTYCWFSSWPGDTNYQPLAPATEFSHDGSDECLTIGPFQPTLHTNVSNAGPVTPSTTLHDSVTFDTGPATPSNGVYGSVTFKLYGPSTTAFGACSGTPTTLTAVAVDGTHSTYNSPDVSPAGPGFYAFTVSYAPGTGDANNSAVAETACSASNEQFQVQQFNPALTTAQTVVISDSATITDGGGGGDLAGTAHFRAYSDSSCTSGNELTTAQDDRTVAGASPQTVSTTASVTFTGNGAHTVYWKVSYTSTNPAQTDIAATCTEHTVSTITN